MGRNASVTLAWGDGDYVFRLAWGQLIMLQEACDAGPFVILQRLADSTWRVGDISHVIRIGLIGGGMKPTDALKLVRTYVEDRPPLENLLTAQAILAAGVMGAPDEDSLKKNESQTTASASTISQTESFESGNSTAPVQ